MGAVKAVGSQRSVGSGIKGGKAKGLAQLAVSVVGAKARPVVVGAVINILALVGGKGGAHVHKAAAGRLHRSGKLVKVAVLVQQRSVCGHVFFIDIAGGGCQQHIHLARVALAQAGERCRVFGQGALLAGKQPVGAGEHHVLLAQQDAAVLLLLQQGSLHYALQADPLIAPRYLILDVFGVGGKVAVQPLGGELGQRRALAEGGVLQLAVTAVRGDHIQREQPDEKQAEHHQHRVMQKGGGLFIVFGHLPASLKVKVQERAVGAAHHIGGGDHQQRQDGGAAGDHVFAQHVPQLFD